MVILLFTHLVTKIIYQHKTQFIKFVIEMPWNIINVTQTMTITLYDQNYGSLIRPLTRKKLITF